MEMIQDFEKKYLEAQIHQVEGKYVRLEESNAAIDRYIGLIDKKYLQKLDGLLDIGCFNGYFLERIPAEKKTGIDLLQKNIDECFKRKIFAIRADLRKQLPLLDREKFDFINAKDILEHIPKENQEDLVKNLCDRLTDRGILLISVPLEEIGTYKHPGFFRTFQDLFNLVPSAFKVIEEIEIRKNKDKKCYIFVCKKSYME